MEAINTFGHHIYVVLVAASVVVGFFLALILLRQQRADKRTNTIQALLLITLSLSVALNAYLDRFIPENYPGIWIFPEPFLLLIGPLFYAYIYALPGMPVRPRNRYLHAAPFLVMAVLFVLFIANTQQAVSSLDGLRYASALLWLFIYIHFWFYYYLNRRALNRFRAGLLQSRSSIEKVYQKWVSYCLNLLLLCYTVLGFLFLLGHGGIMVPINEVLSVIFAVVIYGIGYRTLSRPALFTGPGGEDVATNAAASARNDDAKYKKSGLADDRVQKQLDDVKAFMAKEKPYLDPELDLNGLATLLAMSPHHLSQVINDGAQCNFYEFVNMYRLEEAKALLADPANDHLTVLGLAFEAGFNSKATFNRFFKKATQQTPSQYRTSHRG